MNQEVKNSGSERLSRLGKLGGRKFGAVLLAFMILLTALLLTIFVLPDNQFAWTAIGGMTTMFSFVSIAFITGNVGEKILPGMLGRKQAQK